jgi:hypothetical protein
MNRPGLGFSLLAGFCALQLRRAASKKHDGSVGSVGLGYSTKSLIRKAS